MTINIEMYAIIAAALIAAGAALGILAVVSLGPRRAGKADGLAIDSPDLTMGAAEPAWPDAVATVRSDSPVPTGR